MTVKLVGAIFRARTLEEVCIEIPGQETSPEHEVLVLDLTVSLISFV